MTTPYLVADVPTLVAGFVGEGPCREMLGLVFDGDAFLMTTVDINDEYRSAIGRDGVRAVVLRSGLDSAAYLERLASVLATARTIFATGPAPALGASRHRPFLHCAVAANADYLVTRDRDLLDLATIESTRIVTPEQFLAFYANA